MAWNRFTTPNPAAINAVNVPLEEMLEATKSWQDSGFNVFSGGDLRRMGISAATVAALGQALSDPAAEVAVYARQYRDDAKGPSASVLSLKDGSGGRIALYQQARTAGSGEAWLAICPATPQLMQVGVKTVLDTLPVRRVEERIAGSDAWYAKYKVHAIRLDKFCGRDANAANSSRISCKAESSGPQLLIARRGK